MSKTHVKEWSNVTAIRCDIPECGNVIHISPASQPKYWGRMVVKTRDEKQSIEVDLCPECSTNLFKLINDYRRPNSGWTTGTAEVKEQRWERLANWPGPSIPKDGWQ